MWAEPLIVAALVVGLILWVVDLSSARSTARARAPSLEPVLARVARTLGGELSREPLELRFEVEGAPARVRAEPGCAVLHIDLSCLRHLDAVRELCRRWDRPIEAFAALRQHRYAPQALRLRRHELCMRIGRVPTVRRILGCADFARLLVPLLVQASLKAARPPYR